MSGVLRFIYPLSLTISDHLQRATKSSPRRSKPSARCCSGSESIVSPSLSEPLIDHTPRSPRLRKYTEVLSRAFGDDFEQTLINNGPLGALPSSSSSSFASPALRGKLVRQSLGGAGLATPTSGSMPLRRRISDRTAGDSLIEEDSTVGEGEETANAEGGEAQNGSLLNAEALSAHLDAVQTLLRSMEKRIIDRETELLAVEKRAREEAKRAQETGQQLEELVRKLREERA